MADDWPLVVSSFQSQYGIRLSTELSSMTYKEFAYFLIGLSADTPLGRIISIRAEDDPKVYKEFTPEQRRIRYEYRAKMAKKKSAKDVDSALDSIKDAFMKLAT